MSYNNIYVIVDMESFYVHPIDMLRSIEQEVRNKLISINISELNKMDIAVGVTREPYLAYDQVKNEFDKMVVPFPSAKIDQSESDRILLFFDIVTQITPLPRYKFKN